MSKPTFRVDAQNMISYVDWPDGRVLNLRPPAFDYHTRTGTIILDDDVPTNTRLPAFACLMTGTIINGTFVPVYDYFVWRGPNGTFQIVEGILECPPPQRQLEGKCNP